MFNNNFMKRLLLAVLVLCSFHSASAQGGRKKSTPGKYYLVVYAGGGWFNYVGPIGTPALGNTLSVKRDHPIGTLRVMFQPDHRLRVGIETGYTNFYTYTQKTGGTTGKVNLNGIPLLLVWSMGITPRFNVFGGIGSYLLTTNLDYGGKVKSHFVGLGVSGAVSYLQPISDRVGIAAEVKWLHATQTKDYGLSGQLQLVWKFLEW
jgi:hypothetical protein